MRFNLHNRMSSRSGRRNPALAVLLLTAVLGLTACVDPTKGTTNIITDLLLSGRSRLPSDCFSPGQGRPAPRVCSEAEKEAAFFVEIGKPIEVFPLGQGRCLNATVDFGDGSAPSTFINAVPQNGSAPFNWKATHAYTGWPGQKMIRVKGDSSCLGEVTRVVPVGIGPNNQGDFKLGFCVGPRCPSSPTAVCTTVSMPPIRRGSGVRIETNGQTINYGSNQVFNASGDATAPVPAGYLFPGRKKFSLVYRIGTTNFQGEAGAVAFIADQTAPLEICTNDNPGLLGDNVGTMVITIAVNELSAR